MASMRVRFKHSKGMHHADPQICMHIAIASLLLCMDLSHACRDSQWALVDFSDLVDIVPIDQVTLKKTDGSNWP